MKLNEPFAGDELKYGCNFVGEALDFDICGDFLFA